MFLWRTKVANFPRLCADDYPYPAFGDLSPNGLWLKEFCYSKNEQDLILTLSNRDKQILWKFRYQDYIPHLDFWSHGGMWIVHWSNDGEYAYFTASLGGDGGQCFDVPPFNTGTGLFRVDLQTGRVTAIIPLSDEFIWYSFSFSPTERRLVYGARARDLKILDMATGQLIDVVHKTDFDYGGCYVCSPDGLKFVYSTVLSYDHEERDSVSVRLVDAQSGSERILLEAPNTCFAVTSWEKDNVLTVETNYGQSSIEFDLNSNKIIRESTPSP